jgi:hypothetical protein
LYVERQLTSPKLDAVRGAILGGKQTFPDELRGRAMPSKDVADQFVYGIVGDSLNGLKDTIHRHEKIDWIDLWHEEVAAFAAISGRTDVVVNLAKENLRRCEDRS